MNEMAALTEHVSYADAQRLCSPARLWELFDGDRERAQHRARVHRPPCRPPGPRAVRVAHADGRDETLTFARPRRRVVALRPLAGRAGIAAGRPRGDHARAVAAFYAGLFGAMKRGRDRGAAVHAVRPRRPAPARRRLHAAAAAHHAEKADTRARHRRACDVVVADDGLHGRARRAIPTRYATATRADDLAVFQYTSGTTRELPAAVKHTHRAHRDADGRRALRHRHPAGRPRSSARPRRRGATASGTARWRPLALGVTTGAFAGKFDAVRLLRALARAPDHQPLGRGHPLPHDEELRAPRPLPLRDPTSSPSPASRSTAATRAFVEETFGTPVCSMYGTTEVGVILANYPGAPDFAVKPGSLGKPVPGAAGRGAAPRRHALRSGRGRRDQGVAARRVVPHQGPRLDRRGRLLLPRRPRRRRHHLRRLDDERGRDRGRAAQAPRRPRGRGDRRARRAARPGGEGLRRQRRAPGDEAFAARAAGLGRAPASASTSIRARSSSSPSCPRRRPARSTARCCATASACSPGDSMMPPETDAQRHFPKITEQGARRSAPAHRRADRPTRSSRGATRPRATTSATTRTASATTTRSGATRPTRRSTRYGGIVALPSFLFATSRIVSGYVGGLPACTPCGRAPTGPGTAGAAQRRDHHRGLAEGPGRARDARSPAARSSRSTTSISSTSAATRSPRPTAGASAPSATTRARRAPSTPR